MDREMLRDHLAQAEREVAEGEEHVARQRGIVDQLERHGHDTGSALKLLGEFHELLAMHIADRERIKKELAELG